MDFHGKRLGVLTSGGDAQGMNAAVRAVVRTALHHGADVWAVYEGFQGLVDGGDRVRPIGWEDVSGILHRGGTVIGTARSQAFRERAGRLDAAQHLIELGIDRLVVIGGDGSLTGAQLLRDDWPGLVAELVSLGRIDGDLAARHPALMIAGLVGSIDNDMVGTDMTIGADSALHRIVEAIDAITSTAASHQRSFVVEVMGRSCGYLALMSAIAGGSDYVIIPEHPPIDGWEDHMCSLLREGRAAGRRDSIVLVAEGSLDRHGNPITSAYVRQVLEDRLGEDTRVTILGHVQRGGTPSAFDRSMSSLLGYAAVETVLGAAADDEPLVVGLRYNRVSRLPLTDCVENTRRVAAHIKAHEYQEAMELRGSSYAEMFEMFTSMAHALPSVTPPERPRRLAILNVGGLAPGMNTAARAAVRLGLDRGHTMLGVQGSFRGLLEDRVEDLTWGDVDGWTSEGGAELGISRKVPSVEELYALGRAVERHQIDGLFVIGGWDAFKAVNLIRRKRDKYPAFQIPIVMLPATIDNNIPASELAVGADSALNFVVGSIDRTKQSGTAARRCFVVETMGGFCGYLALMGGLAGGAQRVYLHEEGVTLEDLNDDVTRMIDSFRDGQRLFLAVRNEKSNPMYTTDFLRRMFAQEGGDMFDARQLVLGHAQQGGNPSPFDRVLATRLAAHSIDFLTRQLDEGTDGAACAGLLRGKVRLTSFKELADLADWSFRRPKDQWWMELRRIVHVIAGRTT